MTIITPFQLLPTCRQKIKGVAYTAEEADIQLKLAFFFPVITVRFFTEKPMVDP